MNSVVAEPQIGKEWSDDVLEAEDEGDTVEIRQGDQEQTIVRQKGKPAVVSSRDRHGGCGGDARHTRLRLPEWIDRARSVSALQNPS